MISLLKSRAVVVLIGLVLLALLLWFAGPYFAFAEYKPLETSVARLVAILALVLIYVIVLQVRQIRSSRANAKLATEVVGGGPDAVVEASAGSGADAAQLRKRFDEAIAALKGKKGGANLYELPWYVIIGPPGAGKT